MMRAMKGTRMAAATELLLEAKFGPRELVSGVALSAKCGSITLKSQTHPEVVLSAGHSTLLPSERQVLSSALVQPAEAHAQTAAACLTCSQMVPWKPM